LLSICPYSTGATATEIGPRSEVRGPTSDISSSTSDLGHIQSDISSRTSDLSKSDIFKKWHRIRHSPGMRAFGLIVLLYFTSWLWSATTEPSFTDTPHLAFPIQQPWVLCGGDGSRQVAIRLSGTVELTDITLLCNGKEAESIQPQLRSERLPFQLATTVARWIIPADQLQAGDYRLRVGERSWALPAVQSQAGTNQTRLALAGLSNWPSETELANLSQRLDGPIEAVVADGWTAIDAFGSGGWETKIPILLLPRPPPENHPSSVDISLLAKARVGDALSHWPHGMSWGIVGLTLVASSDDAMQTMARDLSVWQICLTDSSWWNLGILSPILTKQTHHLAPLLSLCQHLDVPLIITLGDSAAWWTEPLVSNAGVVEGKLPGTRVLSATPMAASHMAEMPWSIVGSLAYSGLLGMKATPTTLETIWLNEDKTDGAVLSWSRAEKEPGATARNVLDDIDPVALHARCFPAEPLSDTKSDTKDMLAARAQASTLSRQQLGLMHVLDDKVKLLLAAATVPENMVFLRRLVGDINLSQAIFLKDIAALPPMVARDLLLRQLAFTNDFDSKPWVNYFSATTDTAVLHAVLRARDEAHQSACRDLLVARVRAQALGQIPIESDALLQHRLMTSVFDATDLSPTELRPLAVAIQPKLGTFTVGPVKRFIDRHGTIRR
jgi:hypothetical protein